MNKTMKAWFLTSLLFASSIVVTFGLLADSNAEGTYKAPDIFLKEVFQQKPPSASVIWIKGDVKKGVTQILGHKYPKLRVKYWKQGARTAWVLDEIGKEKPITTGVVINNGKIEQIEVLVFRETRGWEVKFPFFTNQFIGVMSRNDNDSRLNKNIDGVTGATLSVNALRVQARMALYLNQKVQHKK